jgi:hypothetical protein
MDEYIEQFSDYFESSDDEYEFDVNPSLPEFSGCTLVSEGPVYNMQCKDNNDMDSSKPCLLYTCPNVNLTDNIWNQRKSALSRYYKNAGCDDKKIFAGPNMILNGQRVYHGFCNKIDMDNTNNGSPP